MSVQDNDLANLDLSTDEVAALLGIDRAEVELADATIALVERHAALITRMRELRGLGGADLARLLGLSPGRVSQLESGQIRHAVNLKTMAEIAYKLDFDLHVTLRDRQSAESDNTPVADPYSSLRVRVVPVPLVGLTVGDVSRMNARELGDMAKNLADRIAYAHPEAAEQGFLREAAALYDEEESETPRLAHRD